MKFMMWVFLYGLVIGMAGVASNPSPYFAAFGLVVVAGMSSGLLVSYGGSFFSLVLFLIYLGGMLVVFAYCAALAAEPYPESWGSRSVLGYVMAYLGGVLLAVKVWGGAWYPGDWYLVEEADQLSLTRVDTGGVAAMYSFGGSVLLCSAWALLVALFVVLELTRGMSRGALRAV
uniref:NADH-ubiquinone oxidoreductase chain 6 n=1 Tax=Sirembo imberbis TaxID=181399 RepID=Q8HMF8_SIRIM|nr:NADH dehydrogenase subunit 6 [Sirembo imberbis]BAC23201.1 NADH dehydrogenase subunit 6 [Sirembo imberbis]